MKLVGASGQQVAHFLYAADGTIVSPGVAQLVLAKSMSRSYLLIQNVSNGPLWVEIGSARASVQISGGKVTGLTVLNGGFGFTNPPIVRILGGGNDLGGARWANSSYLGLNQPGGSSPSNPATAHAVLTGDAVSSFVVDNPGAGYVKAPYALITNSDLDPYGCAKPSATSGILLGSQGDKLEWNGTVCPTDPVAIYGGDTNAYVCRWSD